MLEIKVKIEAPDLSQAITQLALAVKGEALLSTDNPAELVIPAETPMAVESAAKVEMPADVPSPAVSATVEPVQPPMMNAPVPAPMPETPQAITLDTISRAGAALVDQGKMDDVLNLLKGKYGIQAVTQLRPDQYPAFAEDLKGLGAKL
ncbi:MAG: hypothetical protein IJI25_08965 [Eubacterium sp.]|nr:hypothetical protein [Eubacterium sp.]